MILVVPLLAAAFVVGTLRLLHVPLWLSMLIFAALAWTPALILIHHNMPSFPLIRLIGITVGVAAGVAVLIPWAYAARRWTPRLLHWTWHTRVMQRWRRKLGIPVAAVIVPAEPVDAALAIAAERVTAPPAPAVESSRAVDANASPPLTVSRPSGPTKSRVKTARRQHGLLSLALLRAEPRPVLVALACGWSGLWAGIWYVGFGVTIGLLVGAALGAVAVPMIAVIAGVSIGGGVFAVFALVYLIVSILGSIIAMIIGFCFSWVATKLIIRFEPWIMTVRGYRRLSDREAAVVIPIVHEVAAAMHCATVPIILVHDIPTPGAWTHTRHIVLSKRALDLERAQLAAMIAHELHHYTARDSVRSTFIWVCALPVALLTVVQAWFKSIGGPIFGLIAGFLCWPAMVMLRLMIAPATGVENRRCEYEADAAAADAGYGVGLIRMFESVRVFEPGRTGWDSVMAATHPPIELRIEALLRRSAAALPGETH